MEKGNKKERAEHKRSPQRIFIMELREEPTEMTGKDLDACWP